MICDNILKAVGHTPLIKLNSFADESMADILVKFEAVNIGGSIKTRTALNMIEEAEKSGLLKKGSIIVEPTSGNQGIGLALVCAVKGYGAIIIMPDSVSQERRKTVRQYGAEVILVHDDGDIGRCIAECASLAESIAASDEKYYLPQQFKNPNNTAAHFIYTAGEILEDVGGPIHGFCSGIGTGGTITGIGEALKKANPDIEIWAAEPENAAILSGGNIGTHVQMGIGDGLIPDILNTAIYTSVNIVTDEEALEMAKLLARKEGILCGISSGTNVVTAIKLAKKLGKGKTVVTVIPDMGERYFSTPLFED